MQIILSYLQKQKFVYMQNKLKTHLLLLLNQACAG